jgi:hypothetical protein
LQPAAALVDNGRWTGAAHASADTVQTQRAQRLKRNASMLLQQASNHVHTKLSFTAYVTLTAVPLVFGLPKYSRYIQSLRSELLSGMSKTLPTPLAGKRTVRAMQ